MLKDYVTHEEAVNYQRRSQLLLLAEIDTPHTRGIIPGKLFEYLAAKRPILAIGPEDWEGGEIVKSTNFVNMCLSTDYLFNFLIKIVSGNGLK